MRTHQQGFSVVEVVIVVAVVAILGLVGYSVYNRQNGTTSSGTPDAQAAVATDVPAAPAITTTSDLDTAIATLNQTDPSGSNTTDSGQLDSQLVTF